MIDKIILPFKMFFEIEKILLNISPFTFILINGVGIYWSVGMLVFNRPMLELATFGLTKLISEKDDKTKCKGETK